MQAALLTLKDDRGKTFALDNDMIDIWLLIGIQTNQIKISWSKFKQIWNK